MLRPFARSIVVVAPGLRAPLRSEGAGLFSGVLPLREVQEYRLLVSYDADDDAEDGRDGGDGRGGGREVHDIRTASCPCSASSTCT